MGWLCHPFVLVYSKPYKGKLAEFGEPLFALFAHKLQRKSQTAKSPNAWQLRDKTLLWFTLAAV
jgi:hypothetical protein